MDTETLAWMVLAATALATALFVLGVHYLRLHAKPRTKRRCVVAAILAGIAAFAWGLSTDTRHRRETLFEVICLPPKRCGVGSGQWYQGYSFEVKHPASKHRLEVVPQYRIGTHKFNRPHFPVEIAAKLTDATGLVLVDSRATYEKTRQQALNWDVRNFEFTPERGGTYHLEVSIHTLQTPSVRLRVVDPLLKSGKRVRGF